MATSEYALIPLTSLNQLPYLDAKHEYLWGSRMVSEVAERDVPTLRLDKPHTVRSLTGKLLELARLGAADTGFPILAKEPISEDGRTFGVMRVMGFLGMNELEHALCALTLMTNYLKVKQGKS